MARNLIYKGNLGALIHSTNPTGTEYTFIHGQPTTVEDEDAEHYLKKNHWTEVPFPESMKEIKKEPIVPPKPESVDDRIIKKNSWVEKELNPLGDGENVSAAIADRVKKRKGK